MRSRQTHERVHQPAMLRGHRQQDLLERVRIIVDERQHATESVYEMVEEATVDFRFDAIDEDRKRSR